MPVRSAGILIYPPCEAGLKVLLVHPGGPFWRKKDLGVWQIPKGLIEPGEDAEAAARREGKDELGIDVTEPLIVLCEVKQAGGKIVVAFATERDVETDTIVSNTVEIDWPPRSGRKLIMPEIDEARWFRLADGERYILPSQAPLLERLAALPVRITA
jgi:predicted NUDIX family NTP pyrophosphohydrolase